MKRGLARSEGFNIGGHFVRLLKHLYRREKNRAPFIFEVNRYDSISAILIEILLEMCEDIRLETYTKHTLQHSVGVSMSIRILSPFALANKKRVDFCPQVEKYQRL